jgi:uncharacterized membrane protein YvbJ
MKEKPRFFCDKCGSEVPQDAKNCPSCGGSFASVRCPICGFTGEAAIFNDGCPGCGHSLPPAQEESKPKLSPSKKPQKEQSSLHTLPLWVYVVTGAVFIGVLALLYLSVISA